MNEDKFVFFWGGPFSQWYKHDMEIDGIKYNCAEQFMMAMKAQHFKDDETLAQIMKTKDPAKQKALGRSVKNFVPKEWDAVSREYVYIGNTAKFSDPELKKYILSTKGKEIVEASPYDRIWGIGLDEHDTRRFDKTKWLGTNWLGEVLMRVREDLTST